MATQGGFGSGRQEQRRRRSPQRSRSTRRGGCGRGRPRFARVPEDARTGELPSSLSWSSSPVWARARATAASAETWAAVDDGDCTAARTASRAACSAASRPCSTRAKRGTRKRSGMRTPARRISEEISAWPLSERTRRRRRLMVRPPQRSSARAGGWRSPGRPGGGVAARRASVPRPRRSPSPRQPRALWRAGPLRVAGRRQDRARPDDSRVWATRRGGAGTVLRRRRCDRFRVRVREGACAATPTTKRTSMSAKSPSMRAAPRSPATCA